MRGWGRPLWIFSRCLSCIRAFEQREGRGCREGGGVAEKLRPSWEKLESDDGSLGMMLLFAAKM